MYFGMWCWKKNVAGVLHGDIHVTCTVQHMFNMSHTVTLWLAR